jgi:hypothetical protein
LGAHVLVDAQPSLRWLLEASFPGLGFADEATTQFDYVAAMIDLPAIFRAGCDAVPVEFPYLKADTGRLPAWNRRIGGHGLKVGIAWQGKTRVFLGGRAFALDEFEPLSKIPGVRLISLQKGDGTEQLADCGFAVETLGSNFDTGSDAFIDTMAVMAHLDLVITPDTALAHLAGALGRDVWIALRHAPDWRWHREGADSMWYPTARLFRQARDRTWAPVFADIATALGNLHERQKARQP